MTPSHHHDTYVWTWEPAAGILITAPILAALCLQTGRSTALLAAGAGWHWPTSTDLFTSTWAILHGDALAGVDPATTTQPGMLMWIIAALICTAATGVTTWLMWRHLASPRRRGMATAGEAARLLGTARLRSQRAVIRPDLYGKPTR